MKECLLGFDAREKWISETRPATFLLRGAGELLSADNMVWPSIFSRSVQHFPGLERPLWIGANDPFWEDLGAMEAAISQAGNSLQGPCWSIAATWHTEAAFEVEKREPIGLGPWNLPTNPPHRNENWRFLGFDVTDGGFLSGLMNCGYDDEERPRLVQQWATFLNDHHLFDDVEKAFEFSALSNGRVREHAPFFVIGLWLIRAVNFQLQSITE